MTLQPRPNADEFIGQVIAGKYRLVKSVGVGGMGGVYLAENSETNGLLAIKLLHPDRQQKENIVRRFEREAKITSSLKHPNIVEVYDFGQDPQTHAIYLAMEYLDGKTLYRFVRERQSLDLLTAGEITLAILASLEHAHENKIIHRDLKPGNVMIMERPGQPLLVKVLDFGIAKIYDPESPIGGTGKPPTVLTQFGEMLGTPHYMPPEQIRGQDLSASADLYALGVIFFFMITGRRPFEGQEGIRVTIAQLTQPFPRLAATPSAATLPVTVQELLDKASDKEPSKRFQTADEFRQALEAILRPAGYTGRPMIVPATAPTPAPAPATPAKPPAAQAKPVPPPPKPPAPKVPVPVAKQTSTAPANPPSIRTYNLPPPPSAPRPTGPLQPPPKPAEASAQESDDSTRSDAYAPSLENVDADLGGDGGTAPSVSIDDLLKAEDEKLGKPQEKPASAKDLFATMPGHAAALRRNKDPLMATIPGEGNAFLQDDPINANATVPQREMPDSVRAVIEERKRATAEARAMPPTIPADTPRVTPAATTPELQRSQPPTFPEALRAHPATTPERQAPPAPPRPEPPRPEPVRPPPPRPNPPRAEASPPPKEAPKPPPPLPPPPSESDWLSQPHASLTPAAKPPTRWALLIALFIGLAGAGAVAAHFILKYYASH